MARTHEINISDIFMLIHITGKSIFLVHFRWQLKEFYTCLHATLCLDLDLGLFSECGCKETCLNASIILKIKSIFLF